MPKRNIAEKQMPERIDVQSGMFRITRCKWHDALYPWRFDHRNPPDWRLYYNSAPGSFFRSGSMPPTPFEPDRFYIFPQGYSFSIWAEKPFPHFFIHFRLYAQLPPARKHFELPSDPETLNLINACQNAGHRWDGVLRRTMLAYAIIGRLLAQLPPELFTLHDLPDARIEKICDFFEDHLDCKYSNEELAKMIGMAKNSFIRLFRQKTGFSPQQYRTRRCIEYACCELHHSQHTIDEIAEAAGFSDRGRFSRSFGKLMGMPPGIYRRVTRTRDNPLNSPDYQEDNQ